MSKIGPRIRNRCGWSWTSRNSKGNRVNHECHELVRHTDRHKCGRKHDGKPCDQTHL